MEEGLDQLWKGLVVFTGIGLAVSLYMILNSQPLIPMPDTPSMTSTVFATIQGNKSIAIASIAVMLAIRRAEAHLLFFSFGLARQKAYSTQYSDVYMCVDLLNAPIQSHVEAAFPHPCL